MPFYVLTLKQPPSHRVLPDPPRVDSNCVYNVDKINSAQVFQLNDERDIRVLFDGPRWKFTLSYVDDGPSGVFPL